MVDLPSVQNGMATVHAPQSRISAGQIAEPFNELANTLDKAGETVSKDIAVPLAHQAGLKAVTVDSQGNPTVEKAPIIGDAAVAYSRAVKFSALAQAEAEAKREDLRISKEFHNDPEGYRTAAEAFKTSLVGKWTKAAGDEVGISLGKAIDNATTYNYRWLMLEQQRTIKHNFDRDTHAGIKSAEEDIQSLIQNGALDSKEGIAEVNRLINKRIALTNERVSNPVLSAPPEEAKLDLQRFDQNVGAAGFSARISKILKDEKAGGVEVAQQVVDGVLKDGSLTPQQRALNHAAGLKTIKDYSNEVVRAVHVQNTMQKQTDQLFEDAVIVDRASDKPIITEHDIKTNPQISPEAKMRMLAWVKRDGMPEPDAHISQMAAKDFFRRIYLPDGDPSKINSLSEIREAYAPRDGSRGVLRKEEEQWLEKTFTEGKTPEGQKLTQIRGQFSKAVEPSIDKSNPLLGKIDQSGKLQTFAFERFVDQKIDEYRKAGKSPYDLFDPTKPDYLGKPQIIDQFTVPLEQSIKNIGRSLTGKPSPDGITPAVPAAPPPPQRKPGETPADYLKRLGVQ